MDKFKLASSMKISEKDNHFKIKKKYFIDKNG